MSVPPAPLSATVFIFATLFGTACERGHEDHPPPFRPLVYTESPAQEEAEPREDTNLPICVAPEDLGLALYQALVEHDHERFVSLFVTGPELTDLIRTPEDRAARDATALLDKSQALWSLFTPALAAEEAVGGLDARLRLLDFRIGKGRNLAGKIAKAGADEVHQHWGNDLRLELRGSDKTFVIRVQKIVKTKNGWKIAQALEIDPTLRTYLEAGMHLKSELLTSEHYPFPLEVGNYWKYRLDLEQGQEDATPSEENAATSDTGEANTRLTAKTVTVAITDIMHRDGYLIATFERELRHLEREASTFAYLVTPRAIYPCTRDCRYNVDSVGYLLGYMSQQTPLFVFPLEPGRAWGKAGRAHARNRYEVRDKPAERTVVPAGAFANPTVIVGSIEEGREERYFVPGTGIVKRVLRSGVGPKEEELIDFRLIL